MSVGGATAAARTGSWTASGHSRPVSTRVPATGMITGFSTGIGTGMETETGTETALVTGRDDDSPEVVPAAATRAAGMTTTPVLFEKDLHARLACALWV